MTADDSTHAGLRHWAKGNYALEAGVELLIRPFHGRFAGAWQPWVEPGDGDGVWWIDPEKFDIGALSGGERRLLSVAESLLGGQPVDLAEALPGMDRECVELVLAAVSHASGSHEHYGAGIPLHPWPALDS